MRRTRAAVAATALSGLLLAGCGSDGNNGPEADNEDKNSGESVSLAEFAVPSAYDSTKSWDHEIGWVTDDTNADPVTTDGETVAYIIQSGGRYAVQARDAATGIKGSRASQDIAPEAADPGKTSVGGFVSGTFAGVDSGMFLATWTSADGSDTRLWSAHDLNSGRLPASTACGEQGTDNVTAAVTSPNGRYLALDSVVFDVKAGKGLCLVGDGTRRTINIRALADDGTVYGETDADNGGKSAIELNVNTNSPKALAEGTQLPAVVPKEGAVFTLRENGAGLRVSVRPERQ
ncbi:hypothetical protein [Streptomyces heilongjiangensis]|uniref:Lipoprotein n=1 Tax=Streptomyces heilongjiangensis TaxID=945052 RepID=A0ABW1BCB2_9ACTN|nr:hypothetical protein [Streptomyces heilongjiangensis]MDC2950295.1 hypothetical protein [Streptomyces heilongjiangensis]